MLSRFEEFFVDESFIEPAPRKQPDKLLPNMPKEAELLNGKSIYEKLKEYFEAASEGTVGCTNSVTGSSTEHVLPHSCVQGRDAITNNFCEADSKTEDAVDDASTLIATGKSVLNEHVLASTECDKTDEMVPWVRFDEVKRRMVIVPQELAIYLLGPNAKEPIKVVGCKGDKGASLTLIYQNGYYKEVSRAYLQAFIKKHLPPQIRTSKDIEAVLYEINTEFCTNTDEDLDADEDIINFRNGLLQLSSKKLLKHTPEVASSIQIACNYRPELTLKDAPVFSKFLDDLTSGNVDDKTFLMEYIGAIISNVPGFRFKKLLLVCGAGDTGKSQLFEFVKNMIGEENHHTIDLAQMNERFGSSQLFRKRLSGSGDMSEKRIKEISVLKELTGGDQINAEYKFKGAFSYRYRGYLWYNCNELPQFSGDRGKHVYDRFCIVNCKNVIPLENRDRRLLDKMLEERDAVASAAIRYFSKAVERGYVFTESESMRNMRATYSAKNNSLISFVNECCDLSSGRTKRSDFNRAYEQWSKREGLLTEPMMSRAATLKDEFQIEAVKSGEVYYPLRIENHVMLSLFNY